jgi:hypothetical protein
MRKGIKRGWKGKLILVWDRVGSIILKRMNLKVIL